MGFGFELFCREGGGAVCSEGGDWYLFRCYGSVRGGIFFWMEIGRGVWRRVLEVGCMYDYGLILILIDFY